MSFLLLTFLLLGLFCFWAPTDDDHATSAFYLLTQQRKCHADSQITKLQFLKSSKISKGNFSFFLSHLQKKVTEKVVDTESRVLDGLFYLAF